MSIKYDKDFNAEIKRIVYNFNRKRKRAIKRGIEQVPEQQYVSELKFRYSSKSELIQELKRLEKFNTMGQSAFEVMETLGGGKITAYQLDYMKQSLKQTKEFYDRQIEEASQLFAEEPYSMARKDYLFNLQTKRNYLDLDINYLDSSGLKTFQKYINQAQSYNIKQMAGYRGFLSVVENAMKTVGYDLKTRDAFFGKLINLTPAQFTKLYRNSDLINRVYDLIQSPVHDGLQLNTDEEDAKNILDELINNFDKIKSESLS